MPAFPSPRQSCRRIRLPDHWISQQTLVRVWRFHLRATRIARHGSATPTPLRRTRRGAPRPWRA
jgi:hypothetical protein